MNFFRKLMKNITKTTKQSGMKYNKEKITTLSLRSRESTKTSGITLISKVMISPSSTTLNSSRYSSNSKLLSRTITWAKSLKMRLIQKSTTLISPATRKEPTSTLMTNSTVDCPHMLNLLLRLNY